MAWSPDYCTVYELADFLGIPPGDDQDIAVHELAISAASRAIDRACNRQFGKDDAPTTRYYSATHDATMRRWVVSIDDVMDDTGLTVAYDGTGDESYGDPVNTHRLFPLNANVNGRPWTSLGVTSGVGSRQYAVAVTARFGWSNVPAGIRQATMLQASRFVSRRDSPYGIAGSPDTGSELRLLDKLDPDVAVSIAPYRRLWGAVS